MKFRKHNNIIGLLDIGTQKVCCMILQVGPEGAKVIGHSVKESRGYKYGVITKLSDIEKSVMSAIEDAEKKADIQLEDLTLNFGSPKLTSQIITIEQQLGSNPVSAKDLNELLISTLSQFQEQENREIIHFFPLEYIIGGMSGILDPVGIIGKKLQGKINIISCPSNVMVNLSNCIGGCHLDIKKFALGSYASALAVLNSEEKEQGAIVIDIGAGSTEIAFVKNNQLIYSEFLPLAGDDITNDIAECLQTSFKSAERLKTLYGNADPMPADTNKYVDYKTQVDDVAESSQISVLKLGKIIRHRVIEIFEIINQKIAEKEAKDGITFPKRVILTGGSSLLIGIKECAKDALRRQVRASHPCPENFALPPELNDPKFACISGLAEFAIENLRKEEAHKLSLNQPAFKKIIGWLLERV